MACMTHYCCNCGVEEFNNQYRMVCPQCGRTMHGTFDEVPDDPAWMEDSTERENDEDSHEVDD